MLDADIEVAVEQIGERPEALKALLEGVSLSMQTPQADAETQETQQAIETLLVHFDTVEAYLA